MCGSEHVCNTSPERLWPLISLAIHWQRGAKQTQESCFKRAFDNCFVPSNAHWYHEASYPYQEAEEEEDRTCVCVSTHTCTHPKLHIQTHSCVHRVCCTLQQRSSPPSVTRSGRWQWSCRQQTFMTKGRRSTFCGQGTQTAAASQQSLEQG